MVASNIEVSGAPNLAELVNQSVSDSEVITLTEKGKKRAVLLSIGAFERLIGVWKARQQDLMPADDFEKQFHQALVESGYDSREKIIELVRDVKREMYEERSQLSG